MASRFWKAGVFGIIFSASVFGFALFAQAAKPVEYVKICSLYGAGFYYLPGTDTCIRIGAGPLPTGSGTVCRRDGRPYLLQGTVDCDRRPESPLTWLRICQFPQGGNYYTDTTNSCLGSSANAWGVGTTQSIDQAAANLFGAYSNAPQGQFNWSGFYIGVNGGGMGYETDGNFCPFFCDDGWKTGTKRTGIIGLHGGLQFQNGNFVYGFDGGGTWVMSDAFSSMTGSGLPGVGCAFAAPDQCQALMKNILYVGPRLGLATQFMGNTLFYASGGYANATIESRGFSPVTNTSVLDTTAHHGGWFAGGGVDVAYGKLIIGLDYKHFQFNNASHLPTDVPIDASRIHSDADAVTLRLTIKGGIPGM